MDGDECIAGALVCNYVCQPSMGVVASTFPQLCEQGVGVEWVYGCVDVSPLHFKF